MALALITLFLLSFITVSKAEDEFVILPVRDIVEIQPPDTYTYTPEEYANNKNRVMACINAMSKKHSIPVSIYYSIAKLESGLNPYAINKNKNGTIDVGLMQINSATARHYGIHNIFELFDACKNIEIATKKIKDCYKRYGNTLETIGCYHSENLVYKVRYVKKFYNIYMKVNNNF